MGNEASSENERQARLQMRSYKQFCQDIKHANAIWSATHTAVGWPETAAASHPSTILRTQRVADLLRRCWLIALLYSAGSFVDGRTGCHLSFEPVTNLSHHELRQTHNTAEQTRPDQTVQAHAHRYDASVHCNTSDCRAPTLISHSLLLCLPSGRLLPALAPLPSSLHPPFCPRCRGVQWPCCGGRRAACWWLSARSRYVQSGEPQWKPILARQRWTAAIPHERWMHYTDLVVVCLPVCIPLSRGSQPSVVTGAAVARRGSSGGDADVVDGAEAGAATAASDATEQKADAALRTAKSLTVQQFYHLFLYITQNAPILQHVKAQLKKIRQQRRHHQQSASDGGADVAGTADDSSGSGDDSRVCSICLSADVEVALPCLHAFCTDCIADWHSHDQSCPLCRMKADVNGPAGNDVWLMDGGSETELTELSDTVNNFPHHFLQDKPDAANLGVG